MCDVDKNRRERVSSEGAGQGGRRALRGLGGRDGYHGGGGSGGALEKGGWEFCEAIFDGIPAQTAAHVYAASGEERGWTRRGGGEGRGEEKRGERIAYMPRHQGRTEGPGPGCGPRGMVMCALFERDVDAFACAGRDLRVPIEGGPEQWRDGMRAAPPDSLGSMRHVLGEGFQQRRAVGVSAWEQRCVHERARSQDTTINVRVHVRVPGGLDHRTRIISIAIAGPSGLEPLRGYLGGRLRGHGWARSHCQRESRGEAGGARGGRGQPRRRHVGRRRRSVGCGAERAYRG
jgi:hypothetical protein